VARVPLLRGLFPDPVVTEEVDLFVDSLDELLPEEARALPSARSERFHEFRAGRHCARRALERLGSGGIPVLRADDRSPIWPSGFRGSIAHTRDATRGWCGAAVARTSAVRSVGLDAELDEPLEAKLFRRVLTDAELTWVTAEADATRGFVAKLVFSAKECVYKCQHPLSSEFLDFRDVELTPPSEGRFSAVLRRAAPPFGAGHVFEGLYARRDGFILTALTLE
jgi:4'-phosphopantetheinyl transferase EntD